MKEILELCNGGNWKGKMDESVISAYEAVLGSRFPEDYRFFLAEFGSGHKNGVEIAGIDPLITSDFNVICRTIFQRRDYRFFPQSAIVISDSGDGGQVCMDPSKGSISEVFPMPPSDIIENSIAGNFTEFLSQRLG